MRPNAGTPKSVMNAIQHILTTAAAKGNYKIYAGSGRTQPLGGHIHFSDVSADATLLNALDKFVREPLNRVSNTSERRGSRYFAGGQYSTNSHGWEYRSACSWLAHPVITKGVLIIAWTLAHAAKVGELPQAAANWDSLMAYAKAMPRQKRAWIHIRKFLKFTARMERENITLEQIEVFKAWKKKPRVDPVSVVADTIIPTFIPRIHWLSDDEGIRAVAHSYERLFPGQHSDDTIVIVGGASPLRQVEDGTGPIVYVPENYLSRLAQGHITSVPLTQADGSIIVVLVKVWQLGHVGLSHSLRQNAVNCARSIQVIASAIARPDQLRPRTQRRAIDMAEVAILNTVEGR